MRTVFAILVVAAFTAAGPLFEDNKKYEYPRYIQFPDGDGVAHTVDLQADPDQNVIEDVQRNPDRNLYLLFTRRNPTSSQTLEINNADSIRNSNFNPSHPTVIVVHGWLGNQNTNINPTIRDAYLNKGETNVIVLDWRRLALSDYVTAVLGVPAVGRGLGQFLRFVNQVTGAPFSSMHLVGFSLGAHLVGNAGRELGGAVARVTVGGIGIGTAICNADFFPNGGISQPACITNICNHNRAWELFAATVSYNHLIGRQCSSNWQLFWNRCSGSSLYMGNDDLNKTGFGMYRLDTAPRYPF
ncbi:hypothetical protein MSG28_012414 [Choristoneura fumiferana]|uniref:Uncharacterized protein n=1 Tax=Choristoneura fumiferana TaxID=7141 RepID=A0ACC0KDR9_CHOFU|nr:hypothetical protein MSG28_012414 [Choristoneura fumiferana]